MLSTQLNGGAISQYRPIGHDGEPIYKNAEAFIAALKLHPSVGINKINCLATPKISSDGLNIDWYVPFPPKNASGEHLVVSWNSATTQEQQQALAVLNDLEQSLRKLGFELQRRGAEGQSKLMASYLTGQNSAQNLPAMHFPNPDCVYIVDGHPVITFWGFESGSDDLTRSPLDILRFTPGPSYVRPQTPPNAPMAEGAAPLGQVGQGPVPPAGQVPPGPAPVAAAGGHQCRLGGCAIPLLIGLILIPLLLLLLWWLFPFIWSWLAGLLGLGDSTPNFDLGGGDKAITAPDPQHPMPDNGDNYEISEVVPANNANGDGSDLTINQAPDGDTVINGEPDHYQGGDNIDNSVRGDNFDTSVRGDSIEGDHQTTFSSIDLRDVNLPQLPANLPQIGLADNSLKGKFKGMDLNNDGQIDAVDINDDNQADGVAADPNKDGIVDAAAFDFDKDKYQEGVGLDLDGDGQLDSIGIDENKDGDIDGIDTNGDGKIDLYIGDQGAIVPADTTATVVPVVDPNADIVPTDTPVMLDPAVVDPNATGVDTGVVDPTAGVGIDAAGAGADQGQGQDGAMGTDPNAALANGQNGDAAGQGTQDGANGQNPHNPPVPPELDPNLLNGNQTAAQAGANGQAAQNAAGAANQKNLSFTPNTVQTQGVKVLNGQWSTRSALMDSSNGRPLQMGYTMKDGKGQVEITRADGVKCVAPANAATSSNGVAISASGRAVCPDKSSYQIPNINCSAGADGVVRCNGQSGNTSFPIQLYSAQ